MKRSWAPEATLLIGGWSSLCNACGESADPGEETHATILGYDMTKNGTAGCGIRWTHVYHEYGESNMRLDLERIK